MPVLKGKIKIKATRAYAPGDEIDMEGDADISDEVFNESVKKRLEREKEAQRQLVEKIESQAVEIADLKKKVTTTTPTTPAVDDATTKRLAKLEEDHAATLKQLKDRDEKDRVAAVIEKKAKDLPSVFRDRIQVKAGADDDQIAEAVKEQVEAYAKFKKEHGLADGTGEEEEAVETVGRQGNGAPSSKQTPEGKKALEAVKAVPKLAATITNYDEATRENVALKWSQDGTLAKAQAALTAK